MKEDFDSLFDRSHFVGQKGNQKFDKDNKGQSSQINLEGSGSFKTEEVKCKLPNSSQKDFEFNLDSPASQPFGLDIDFTNENKDNNNLEKERMNHPTGNKEAKKNGSTETSDINYSNRRRKKKVSE